MADQRFAHTEGAVVRQDNGTYMHEYVLRDHLGNTRVTSSDSNNDGIVTSADIKQINNYYPFGLNMEGNWNGAAGNNKYQYNGKEWNDDFRLGCNFYEALLYDPAIGRFLSIDILSEATEEQTPYAYADNNPFVLNDYLGLGTDNGDPNYDPTKDTSVHNENTYTVTAKKSNTLNNVQTALDIAGLIPVLGTATGIINTGIDVLRGNYGSAAFNLATAIPIVGTIKKGAKILAVIAKVAKVLTPATAKIMKSVIPIIARQLKPALHQIHHIYLKLVIET